MARSEPNLQEHCMEELLRLKGTLGFPDGKKALADYCMALAVMETFEGVTALMDDLTRTEMIRMPPAASMRAMAYDRMASVLASRRACSVCDGAGMATQFFLATYEGKNWAVLRSAERIRATAGKSEFETSIDVRDGLRRLNSAEHPPNVLQQVISAAAPCECRQREIAC